MVDETRTTDTSQESPDVSGEAASESVEQLREEDAIADINLDASQAETSAEVSVEEMPESMDKVATDQSAALVDLETQITGLKAQLEDRSSQYMRIAADFENYRKAH